MSNLSKHPADLPLWQQRNRGDRVRPTNPFVEFKRGDLEQSIPERFEKIVRLYPDRIAVKTRNHTLTYDELNKTANRLAHAILSRRGTGEEPIALLLGNHAPMIAAILAVLKTGKTYVPLDASFPRTRINSILEDSQAELIITSNRNFPLANELARNDGRQLLNNDELDGSLSTQNISLSIPPDAPTWILYTSGSTGRPKGVVQNHRNVLHFIMNYTNGFRLCPNDRLTLLFSCSVNGGAHDIFSALLNGAALYPLDIKAEGLAQTANWLIEQEITVYCSVPTVFRHFCETLTGKENFPHLRLIKLIGEPVFKRDVELYQKYFSQSCIFVNRLGSTETGSIRWYFIDKQTQISENNVPVGYPVKDNEILLLDDHGEQVGFNDIGEISVKSRYLSPGYWQRPDLTQAAFQPDPAGGSERTYRTGDLGRMLLDGRLVHLGRKDFQIKIRGYRIEAAEIEEVLLSLDGVKEAFVVAQENPSCNQRLVVYLVLNKQPMPTVTALRRVLAKKLPDYMIPSAFVILDAFPLAPNGKIDRQGLPPPSRARPELESTFVVPRTSVEEVLAGIWREVLDLGQVGTQDNFFDLGGNSLLATQVISRIRVAFRIELPLRTIFETPTVFALAVVIVQNQIDKETAGMLTELESLSDEEVQRLLADESTENRRS